jgi:hypothetical protein
MFGRPLDSLKLDLVTVGTFLSIALTKLKFDDEVSGIVAVVSTSVACLCVCVLCVCVVCVCV